MITSCTNEKIKAAVRLRENAQVRLQERLWFLEGAQLCIDVIESGIQPEVLYVTPSAQQKYLIPWEDITEIGEAVSQKLAGTASPQGVFGLFPEPVALENFWKPQGRYLAFEELQDPGNLGAAARIAEAFGMDGMLCGGGCSVSHPKAMRGSMGALMRVPVRACEKLSDELRDSGLPVFAAVPDPEGAIPVRSCSFSEGGILLIGNEGSGLSEEALALSTTRVTIPMRGRAESLNAAAAAIVLMYEMCKN